MFVAEVLHQDASVGIAGVLYDCALLLARRLVEEPQLLSGKAASCTRKMSKDPDIEKLAKFLW